MTVIILMRYPLYCGAGGGIENGTGVLTGFFLKAGMDVLLISRWAIDSTRKYLFPELTTSFPRPDTPDAVENIAFLKEIAEKHPQAVVWDRGGDLARFMAVCRTHTPWYSLTSLHCDIVSMFNCFTQRIEEAPRKQQLIKWLGYPLWATRYYQQYSRRLRNIAHWSQCCVLLVPALIDKMKRRLPGTITTEFKAIPDPLKYPVASEDILGRKEKRIVLCSRLEHSSKRIDYFLRVWRKIQYDFPEWQVSIVGGPGKNESDWIQRREMEHLKSLCIKWNLQRITFHDYQDPAPYYEKSLIYALTSRNEGFCDTLAEAQAFGCAAICFDAFPSASVLIKDGCNGYLAKPFSIQDYVEKLSEMMRDDNLRRAMGKCSLDNAKQYAVERIGKMWIETFRHLEETK